MDIKPEDLYHYEEMPDLSDEQFIHEQPPGFRKEINGTLVFKVEADQLVYIDSENIVQPFNP